MNHIVLHCQPDFIQMSLKENKSLHVFVVALQRNRYKMFSQNCIILSRTVIF